MFSVHPMRFLRCLCLLISATLTVPAWAADWRPIDPADLKLKQSKLDPNAEAEALFREVRIANEQHGTNYPTNTVEEYVRLKVFSDRGKDRANVQIPYYGRQHISNVQGRTIKPDGTVVPLSKDAIFDKVLEKGGLKTKIVSFALPAVEPGSIIEYRFIRNEGEWTERYRRLEVQSEYPVQELTFFIKPLSNQYFSYPTMRFLPFGCIPERGQVTRDGFEVIQVHNVPAFHEEPFSPPRYTAQSWIFIYYEENSKVGKDQYWTALGKELDNQFKQHVKVNGEARSLAAEITAGANSDGEKLEKILSYCRKELKDVSRDELSGESVANFKENRTSADTLQHKAGTAVDINYAFLALAQAAGFEAHRAELSDRSTFLFDPIMQSRYFLNSFDIAVKVDGAWRFYDVANPALPGGQLRWQEQGVYALIADGKHPEMVQTPMLSAKDSQTQRVGSLSLREDGTLEGDIREIRFGNAASEWRERDRFRNDSSREEGLRDELKQRFSDFQVSKVKFTEPADLSKPVGLTYHIVVSGYAQRTGKRLLVRVNYFGPSFGNQLPQGTRYNHIYFPYPWSEVDTLEIKIPSGFVLDHADAPANVNAAPTCVYAVRISFTKSKNTLVYNRQLTFGDKTLLLFDKKSYPDMRSLFDGVYTSDEHMLTLKSDEAAVASTQE
jgi:hypothetical protein